MSINPDPKQRLYTAEDYLAAEDLAEYRSEYHDGEIFAMVGGTESHNAITHNLSGIFFALLRGLPCRAFVEGMKVVIGRDAKFYYPDLLIVCGEPAYRDKKKIALLNPRVIFEVLSESTAAFDHDQKFEAYQQIDSLTDYILVAQDRPRIEHFKRQPDGDWLLHIAAGLEASFQIQSIECRLDLVDVYDRVVFETNFPREPARG